MQHQRKCNTNKIIQTVNAKKFFIVNNMTNFDRVTAFDNLNIYCIVPIDDICT